jgi:acetaldehyde dehydrogenase/alcohol dehydrogenase
MTRLEVRSSARASGDAQRPPQVADTRSEPPRPAPAATPQTRGAADDQERIEAAVDILVRDAATALDAYADYDQERIDHIVRKASLAGLAAHTRLAMLAVEETGRGVFEDKAVKNVFACENVTHAIARTSRTRWPGCARSG